MSNGTHGQRSSNYSKQQLIPCESRRSPASSATVATRAAKLGAMYKGKNNVPRVITWRKSGLVSTTVWPTATHNG